MTKAKLAYQARRKARALPRWGVAALMRHSGARYAQIARAFGICPARAFRMVQNAEEFRLNNKTQKQTHGN